MSASHRLPSRKSSFLGALSFLFLFALFLQPAAADSTPTLQFSTYLGGLNPENAADIQVDAQGYIYVVGNTHSDNFPISANAAQDTRAGESDVYIVKLNPQGNDIIYSTYLGGSGYDKAYGIALDSDGSVYVTGTTLSNNFPTIHAVQTTYGGSQDAFVAKLNPDGSQFIYSTYLGGSGSDAAIGIGVDANHHARIAGFTASNNLPTHAAYQASINGTGDILFASLIPDGSAFDYLTYLGGGNSEAAMDVFVDDSGNSYLSGFTTSSDYPTIDPFQDTYSTPGCSSASNICHDGFVTRLNADGVPTYSTYIGGNGRDEVYAIALDGDANMYLTGQTSSLNFPVANPYQATLPGTDSAFVSKLNAAGSSLIYSTYLGGSNGLNVGVDISVNLLGNAFVSGYTNTTNFPVMKAIQATRGGTYATDAFITMFSPDGTALEFSTYLGGTEDDYNEFNPRLALNASGDAIHIAGTTISTDFPIYNALQDEPGGGEGDIVSMPNFDGFIAKIAVDIPLPPDPTATPIPTATPTVSAPSASTTHNYFTTDTPTLTWTPVIWATHYHVQVSKDKFFTGTPDFEDVTGGNELFMTTDSLDDGLYYWRVQAQKADGSYGGWSPVESFTVDAD
jgi:hypothetical protein